MKFYQRDFQKWSFLVEEAAIYCILINVAQGKVPLPSKRLKTFLYYSK